MLSEVRYASQAQEHAAFRAMFRARKEVFVDLLKWDLTIAADQYEIDHFDNVDAWYVMLMKEGPVHRASARLLRTDIPHLLGDCYPHLCAGPVPSGTTIREVTRFCLDRHQTAAQRRSARNQLVTALAEQALARGITAYTGVAEQSWFEQIREFGWDCEALGQPIKHDCGWLTALHIAIGPDTLAGLKTRGTYEPTGIAFCPGKGALQ